MFARAAFVFLLIFNSPFRAMSADKKGQNEISAEAAKLWEEQVKEDQANQKKATAEPAPEEPKQETEKVPANDAIKAQKARKAKAAKAKEIKRAEEKASQLEKAAKPEKGKGVEKGLEKKADEKTLPVEKGEKNLLEAGSPEKPAVVAPADGPVAVRVIRAKAGKAIIVHSKKVKLEKKRYSLGSFHQAGEEDDEPSRRWFIGGSTDMGLFNQTTSINGTDTKSDFKSFVLNASFGRNFGVFEVGPFVEYSFLTIGNSDTKTLIGGLLVDVNFGHNDVDADGIFGLRLSIGMGQEDASTLTEAGKVMRIQPSLFFKWFLSDEAALVIEMGYRNQSADFGTQKVTTVGPVGRIGVLGYF